MCAIIQVCFLRWRWADVVNISGNLLIDQVLTKEGKLRTESNALARLSHIIKL